VRNEPPSSDGPHERSRPTTLTNRVTPFNTLVADPAYRGMFMGNRGVLHGDRHNIVRWRNGTAWITCLTEYKGRTHVPMTPGFYTELFFLDEVTSLAAGHRPCAMCRRERFNAFRQAIASTGGGMLSATELDTALDAERRVGDAQRRHSVPMSEVPDGAMVAIDAVAFMVREGQLFEWSSTGYGAPRSLPVGEVEMLTPPLTARALRGGYRPEVFA
jgi:hypothetical protein